MRNLVMVSVLAVLAAASVGAQPTPGTSGKPVRCRDLFTRNADGSWTPKQPVTINGVSFGPAVSVRPGIAMGGVDVGKVCESDGTFAR